MSLYNILGECGRYNKRGKTTESEWRDSNPRPHAPHACILPTELHSDFVDK